MPHKFEAGTPNVGGAVGLAAAMDYLDGIGHDAIAAHEQRAGRATALEQLGACARAAAVRADATRKSASPSSRSRCDGVHPHDIATILDAEGIAIRAGHHCAQPLMRRLGVPATTRASCWIYTTTDDLDRLVEGLASVQRIFG